ncbi:MAG: trigger factor [Candidatus Saccharibacteria bacterium]
MKLVNNDSTKTRATYTLAAEDSDLDKYRQVVASELASTVKVPGFRPNKAPADMILKYADQSTLQNEFLTHAVNDLYLQSQSLLNYRFAGEPKIDIAKFVPYTSLEVKIEVPIITDVKLPNYKSLKLAKASVTPAKKQIDDNLRELQKRVAKPKAVKRAAKLGDLVVIDFDGSDTKTKEKLASASGKDFRLVLGDNTLIPGFEDNLVGLTIGKSKSFDLTFPKDYQDKSFASRKVTFKATIKEVNEVELPKLDDAFAKTVGPFKTLDELKKELKRQLEAENERQATIDLENQILNELSKKVVVELDEILVDSEYELLLQNAQQSALNRGQTWQEFLASLGESNESYEKQLREVAITRIKGGLAVGEIATKENITVTDTELDQQIVNLKRQYSDPQMQQELDNPNNRRELGMRLLTEKVLDFIQSNQASKAPTKS